jgi:hypothetical protein
VNYTASSITADRGTKPHQSLDPNMGRFVHGPIRPIADRSLRWRLLHRELGD